LVAFRLSHTLDRRVLPQWSAPRRLEHIPIEWKSACGSRSICYRMSFSENRLPPIGSSPRACFSGICPRPQSDRVGADHPDADRDTGGKKLEINRSGRASAR
jgi:hypothetical protein